MKALVSTGLAVLALLVNAPLASAQRWCSSPDRQTLSYLDCSLRLEGDRLVQGFSETVAVAGSITGFPLRRFVSGDSAERYAGLYERGATRAGAVRFIGGALLLAGSVITVTHGQPATGVPRTLGIGPRMMLSGLSIHLLSFPLWWRADRDAERAVWWNNAALRREP